MFKILLNFFLISTVFIPPKPSGAQSSENKPTNPCSNNFTPDFSKKNQPLSIQIWKRDQIPNWVPPSCLGWKSTNFDFLISSIGRFTSADDINVISQRIISFSKLKNIVYWSVTNNEWRKLFDDAGTLSDSNVKLRRKDFTAENVRAGATFYYVQDENTMLSPVIFRMTILERKQNKLAFFSVNVSPFKVAFLEAVKPGKFEQYYTIQKESGDTWLYFSLVRSKMNYSFLAPKRLSSLNRTAAYFRHVAGMTYRKFPFITE